MQTLVALYRSFDQANSAMDDLVREGIDRSAISIMANNTTGDYDRYVKTEDAVKAGEGAVVGAAAGAGIGAAALLGMLAVPGIGPVLAAGPLAAALVGGTIGAAAGAPTGAVVAAFVKTNDIEEEDADIYAEGLRRGGTLLSVQVDDSLATHVSAILEKYDPIDLDQEAHTWRERGWDRFNEDAQPLSHEEIAEYRMTRANMGLDNGEADDHIEQDNADEGTYRVRSYPRQGRSQPEHHEVL
ncbi:MAG: hypothetical protein U0528_06535 [Anaerolineae bacterium]|nr:hypothetical protein [Anaerolineae bacterium]